MPRERIVAVTTSNEDLAWGKLWDGGGLVDGGGNEFACYLRNAPDVPNQAVGILIRRDVLGNTREWEIVCPWGNKADSVGLRVNLLGTYVDVLLTGHSEATSHHRSEARIENVFTPFQMGGGGGGTGRPLPRVPEGQQTFTDVAPTDTFWREIETLYMVGAIGGYQNGEFRPGNPLTRGQLCKILVNALRYMGG